MNDLDHHAGKRVKHITYADALGYEPTSVSIEFDDGSWVAFHAGSVMYDQYSSSPMLSHTEGNRPTPFF